jgi:hypothetical protein
LIKNILAGLGLVCVLGPIVSKNCRTEMIRSYQRERRRQQIGFTLPEFTLDTSLFTGFRPFADK